MHRDPSLDPATSAYRVPLREVARRYPADDAERLDAIAGGWALVFCGAWAALVAGWLPAWAFVLIGLPAFIRNFNALHESFHARRRHDRAWLGRRLTLVTGPLMLGYAALRDNHRRHHAWTGHAGRDPDHYLLSGPWWVALLNALSQPEQSVVRYVARCGWSRALVGDLVLHASLFAAVAWVGWGAPLVWWLLVTRAGNAASWFIFDWCIHHPRLWGSDRGPRLPSALRRAWALAFSRNNLYGVEHHHVHHQYPFVPDAKLPRLAAELSRRSVARAA